MVTVFHQRKREGCSTVRMSSSPLNCLREVPGSAQIMPADYVTNTYRSGSNTAAANSLERCV